MPTSLEGDAASGGKAGSEGERVRFVGKHSKDTCLSLYVQKRNIAEVEGGNNSNGNSGGCEPLGCIVRIRPDAAAALGSRGQAVVVGILARLVCDFGLQYTEHALYQIETQLYPALDMDTRRGGVFEFGTRFVTSLPDEYHIPFLARLPPGLPSSVQLRGAGLTGASSHWGLTYYVFAYITSAQAAAATLARHGVEGAWPRLKIGRRHSKVFLSFAKTTVGSVERISRALPPSVGNAKRRSLFAGSTSPLLLEAALDKAAYVAGEPIVVSFRLRNMGRQRVAGIRITVKQLLTVKYGSEPRHVIKTTVAEYEGHERYLRDRLQYDTTVTVDTRFNPGPNNYQMALEGRYAAPGTAPGPVLASSCSFAGLAWGGGPTFGIERLRVFTVEYYVNVHAVIPWASNVIVKLPFQLVAGGENGSGERRTPISDGPNTRLTGGNGHGSGNTINNNLNNLSNSNLIAFDLDEDEQQHGMDEDDVDLDDDGAILKMTRRSSSPGKAPSSSSKCTPPSADDLRAAQAKVEEASARLRTAHRDAVAQNEQLDRRTIALRFAGRRVEMARTLLEHVNILVTQDLPRLKQGASAAAAQAVATRLLSLGLAHAAVVPLGFAGAELVEEHLEVMSRLIDDFELYLARALQAAEGAAATATALLDRMAEGTARLVKALPGYYAMETALRALRRAVLRNQWATLRGRGNIGAAAAAGPLQDDHSDDEDEDEGAGAGAVRDEHGFEGRDQLLAAMAEQFQSLYAAGSAGDDDNYEAFPVEYREYVSRLNALLASGDPAEASALGPTAYFHWRFLLALGEHFHVNAVATAPGRLLFSDLRDSLRWGTHVERNIPARFLLDGKIENELEESANQIIHCMQRL